jgi:hypothetical protein
LDHESNLSPFINGRLRRAPWVKDEPLGSDCVRLVQKGGNGRGSAAARGLDLDPTASLLWRTCDGSRSLDATVAMFVDAYADGAESTARVRNDTLEVIDNLLRQDFLVVDGGEASLYGDARTDADGAPLVVRRITPGVELQWQLETMRQFLFGVMRVEEADGIESDFEALLGAGALDRAKVADADSASQRRDSNVIQYRGSMKSPSFAACVNAIVAELEAAIPESAGALELSGNAIYLRGAHMGWHSNHSRSDRRVYCSWCERPNANFFRYEHPLTGEIVTDWETPGWNVKTFAIPARPTRFWHCIGAGSLRLALGFRYPRKPNPA